MFFNVKFKKKAEKDHDSKIGPKLIEKTYIYSQKALL